MGNIKKAFYYLKRNGLIDTWYAVRERTDVRHMDELSVFMKNYTGREKVSDIEKKRQRKTVFEKEFFFSILVPAYETAPEYLSELIDSVLAQTYGRYELIIADASESDVVIPVSAITGLKKTAVSQPIPMKRSYLQREIISGCWIMMIRWSLMPFTE